jgi:hypothetical protein
MIPGLAAPTSGRALVFDHPYAQLPRLGFDDRRHPRDQPVNGTAKSL